MDQEETERARIKNFLDTYNKKINYDYSYSPSEIEIPNRGKITLGGLKELKNNSHKYDVVITLWHEYNPPFLPDTKHYQFRIDDEEDADEIFYRNLPMMITTLDHHLERGDRIYIHCYAGISRSPTFVICYLICRANMNPLEAISYLKEKRNCIYPNFGFIKLIVKFYKTWKQKTS